MNIEEYKKLTLNKRVKRTFVNQFFEIETKFGYVIKVYNNFQVKVWFDYENAPRVVGYTQIDLD